MRLLSLPILCLALIMDASAAETAPTIATIRFEGNKVTKEKVLLREMDLQPGARADPAALERNRQAILDLGLFRSVKIIQEPAPDGRVGLLIKLHEKRFVLPIPRLDTSSDEDYSYGAQLRWNNLWGLNHRLNAYVEEGRYPNELRRESEQLARIKYWAPYIADSPYILSVNAEHEEQVTPDPSGGEGSYDERFARLEVLLGRDFRTGRPRTGWSAGAGVFWEDQVAKGHGAPPSDGMATALTLRADYDDMRFHLYSETGRRFDTNLRGAVDGFASDYGYTRWTGEYFESRAIGNTEHQTLHFLGAAGILVDGPDSRNEFSLGGSGRLRGYDTDTLQGDRFYYAAAEYLRPLRWNWLRLLVVAEAGGVSDDNFGNSDGSLHASVGVGLRIRLTWFVNVEIELGVAAPLRNGDGVRFFAGSSN